MGLKRTPLEADFLYPGRRCRIRAQMGINKSNYEKTGVEFLF